VWREQLSQCALNVRSSMSVGQQDATWTDQDTNEVVLVEQINRLLLTDKHIT